MFESLPIVNPSFIEPQTVLQISQRSGAFNLLPKQSLKIRLSTNDLYVYIKTLEMRSTLNSGQSAGNQLQGPAFISKLRSTPTYMVRSEVEFNHHDVAAAGVWDVDLMNAYRKAVHQSFAQNARDALLYGFNPTDGEGLLNTAGLTSVNLPPDMSNNTTFRTYDNGQFGLFLLQQIVATQIRLFQSAESGNKVVVLGPQRILATAIKANIVQLVQYQRAGAGTHTTGGMVTDVLENAGDLITWAYDDTLIGKGSGGTDAVLIIIPELEDQGNHPGPNTNEFAKLQPAFTDCTAQYADMVAPREITTPVAGGVTDVLYERRITPGWGVRPEAITLLNISY